MVFTYFEDKSSEEIDMYGMCESFNNNCEEWDWSDEGNLVTFCADVTPQEGID